jgi:hypothetical protein
MPLAFGSILGGMTTLIGTPPNLIVSGFRAEADGAGSFAMFDFTPGRPRGGAWPACCSSRWSAGGWCRRASARAARASRPAPT